MPQAVRVEGDWYARTPKAPLGGGYGSDLDGKVVHIRNTVGTAWKLKVHPNGCGHITAYSVVTGKKHAQTVKGIRALIDEGMLEFMSGPLDGYR